MPRKPELAAVRAELLNRLAAGEQMSWKKLVRIDKQAAAKRRWAHDTLSRLHARGAIRVLKWVRGNSGPAMPVFVLADGKPDKPRPAPLSSGEKSKRWRINHPHAVSAAKARYQYVRKSRRPIIGSVLSNFVRSVLHPVERIPH